MGQVRSHASGRTWENSEQRDNVINTEEGAGILMRLAAPHRTERCGVHSAAGRQTRVLRDVRIVPHPVSRDGGGCATSSCMAHRRVIVDWNLLHGKCDLLHSACL